ncbi:MAG: phosphocholine cytidylyltransferase family protein [Polyangiaceae bacterium]|nr:phosphocholine cytidylyltransferase family protein [Polyangiaceae bacterium]MCW5791850.1 phosphocholine cytidylyltransferase family protein [Polyangiaceae bacterium]
MRAIVIGAGRGSRLQHKTDEIPKTLVPVMGRPMLEWILEALAEAGFARQDVVFIAGYRAEVVRARYPELTYVINSSWEQNNILGSLMCAREHLSGGFVASYADIIYDGPAATRVATSPHDLCLGCDTDWRRRYLDRSQHPETDAEKLRAEGTRVVQLSRTLDSEQASGEFIGVMKASAAGADRLTRAYDEAAARFAGGPYREGRSFERAYLLDLLADMLEQGVEMHRADTHGAYMEIDTLEDHACAERWWQGRTAAP